MQCVGNSHPDRRVADSVAGDVLVFDRRRKYRMLAVQRFGDGGDPWFDSVPECLAWIAEWERRNAEFHRRWWAATAVDALRGQKSPLRGQLGG
ncbi:MAG: hypothetical protein U0992_17370 [Planctomycetaceae bacterium]